MLYIFIYLVESVEYKKNHMQYVFCIFNTDIPRLIGHGGLMEDIGGEGEKAVANCGCGVSTSADCTSGNVKRDRRRIRDVQALDRAGQVEAGEEVAGFARELAQTLALGAHDEGERRA